MLPVSYKQDQILPYFFLCKQSDPFHLFQFWEQFLHILLYTLRHFWLKWKLTEKINVCKQ